MKSRKRKISSSTFSNGVKMCASSCENVRTRVRPAVTPESS